MGQIKTVRGLLRRARLVAETKGHCKGSLFRVGRMDVFSPSADVTAVCSLGALEWAAREAGLRWYDKPVTIAKGILDDVVEESRWAARRYKEKGFFFGDITDYNDSPKVRKSQVLRVFDKAIERAPARA